MAIPQVVSWPAMRELLFPVSGAGANIPAGTLLMPGVTAGTNLGVAIPITAASNLGALGILNEMHNYAASGDATTATLVRWFPSSGVAGGSSLLNVAVGSNGGPFPSHNVSLLDTATVLQMDYDLTATVAVASNTTVSIVITNLETNIDSGYFYVTAGTGIGQLLCIKSSTGGTATMYQAPTTGLDSTSKVAKILPLFHEYPVWKINSATAANTLGSTAAIGTGRATQLASFISKNGQISRLDPKLHDQASGLNSLAQFSIFSHMALIDTILHPLA